MRKQTNISTKPGMFSCRRDAHKIRSYLYAMLTDYSVGAILSSVTMMAATFVASLQTRNEEIHNHT